VRVLLLCWRGLLLHHDSSTFHGCRTCLVFCVCLFSLTGASSELRLGDTVVALGHPLGLKFAASSGIVSSTDNVYGDELILPKPGIIPECVALVLRRKGLPPDRCPFLVQLTPSVCHTWWLACCVCRLTTTYHSSVNVATMIQVCSNAPSPRPPSRCSVHTRVRANVYACACVVLRRTPRLFRATQVAL